MFDLVSKIATALLDKYPSIFRYVPAVLITCLLISLLALYFFWDAAVDSRLDSYVTAKIDAYFERSAIGGAQSKHSANKRFSELESRLGARISELDQRLDSFKTSIERIKGSLYDDVDAVYSISFSFSPDDYKLPKGKIVALSQYIYADLTKHKVRVVVNKRLNAFNISLCVNDSAKSCSKRNSNLNEDITALMQQYPLKASSSAEETDRDDDLAYPANIHLITIVPQQINWDARTSASIEGYIIVSRRLD